MAILNRFKGLPIKPGHGTWRYYSYEVGSFLMRPSTVEEAFGSIKTMEAGETRNRQSI